MGIGNGVQIGYRLCVTTHPTWVEFKTQFRRCTASRAVSTGGVGDGEGGVDAGSAGAVQADVEGDGNIEASNGVEMKRGAGVRGSAAEAEDAAEGAKAGWKGWKMAQGAKAGAKKAEGVDVSKG